MSDIKSRCITYQVRDDEITSCRHNGHTVSGRTSSSLSLNTIVLVLRIIVESARLEERRVI